MLAIDAKVEVITPVPPRGKVKKYLASDDGLTMSYLVEWVAEDGEVHQRAFQESELRELGEDVTVLDAPVAKPMTQREAALAIGHTEAEADAIVAAGQAETAAEAAAILDKAGLGEKPAPAAEAAEVVK